jgi:hypothetical protein
MIEAAASSAFACSSATVGLHDQPHSSSTLSHHDGVLVMHASMMA